MLQVTEENYESCNTSKPIKKYKDGNNTKVKLNKSGPFYFISGADGHCQKGQNLEVTVMSEKHRHHVNPPAFSPKPAIAPAPEPAKTSPNKALAYKDGTFLALASLLGLAFAYTSV